MKFLACDVDWLQGAGGSPVCPGQLAIFTAEEMGGLSGPALNWDQVSELQGEVMLLFALVFGFLVLKKLL